MRTQPTVAHQHLLASMQGRARLLRLIHIAKTAPQLRSSAAAQAADVVKSATSDVQAYQQLVALCNAVVPQPTYTVDDTWIQETTQHVKQEGEKLDLELRNYQNNLIKESIRMANRDLADYYRSCGLLQEALQCYQRTREHCSTAEHVMDMCLSVIEVSERDRGSRWKAACVKLMIYPLFAFAQVALEMQSYATVVAFVNKAEAVLETYNPAAAAGSAGGSARAGGTSTSTTSSIIVPPSKGASTSGADAIGALFRAGGSAAASAASGDQAARGGSADGGQGAAGETRVKNEVARIKAILCVAGGLAALGQGRFEAAATSFLATDPLYASSFAHLLAPGDLALYSTLCSIAVLPRPSLKRMVMDRPTFRSFTEHDPPTRELLDAFWACDYEKTLALLDKWRNRHTLDLYLAPRLGTLRRFVIRRGLQQFLAPFTTVSLTRLAVAFGWSTDQARAECLSLVERGEATSSDKTHDTASRGDWRLDWVDDLLVRLPKDERSDLFEKTMKQAKATIATSERLAFRIELVQQGLTYKEPTQQQVGQGQVPTYGEQTQGAPPRLAPAGRGKGRERRYVDNGEDDDELVESGAAAAGEDEAMLHSASGSGSGSVGAAGSSQPEAVPGGRDDEVDM